MELRGFEPLTFCMPCRPDSSDWVALGPVTAVQIRYCVWGGLARSGGIWAGWHLVWYWFCPGLPVNGDPLCNRIPYDTMTMQTLTVSWPPPDSGSTPQPVVTASASTAVSCLAGNRPRSGKAANSDIRMAGARPVAACLRG